MSASAGRLVGRASWLLLITLATAAIAQNDYCALDPNHTMCQFQSIGPQCGYGSFGGQITEAEKKTILDTHNRLRSIVASGRELKGAPGPQPPATDMQILQWDDELAAVAQRWADQCIFEHDSSRNTWRFSVGQNLFQSEGGVPWEEAIYSWYSEVEFFDNNLVDNFIADNVTGHYTQLAWGNSRYIGCGKRTYPQKRNRYKRESEFPNSYSGIVDFASHSNADENVRKARKINYKSPYSQNNFMDHNKNNYNWDTHVYQAETQRPSTESTWKPQRTTQFARYDSEWDAYNKSLHEYYEKYKNALQNNGEYKAQIDQYKTYLEQAAKLSNRPQNYGGYGYSQSDFNNLREKYENYKNIHDRQLYYAQKLKHRLATKKVLNPVISKSYGFTTHRPVISGVEYEYYVCNYGPSGNFPGSRMYTKGVNNCAYYGLCSDPLTREYYPSLEMENDPILSSLYSSQKQK